MINLEGNPSSLSFTIGPPNPSNKTVAVTSSDSPNFEVPYTASVSQSWDSVAPTSGTTPVTETVTVDSSAVSPGIYVDHLDIVPTSGYAVVNHGSFALPFTPQPSDTFNSKIVFSPTDTSAYWGFYSDNLGPPEEARIVKFDRATNSVVWSVLVHNTDTFQPGALIVSSDGLHLYVVWSHIATGTNNFVVDKLQTSDGSIVGSVTTAGTFKGSAGDIDLVSIGGIDYVAWAGCNNNNVSDKIFETFVVRTSDMSVVIHITYDSGSSVILSTPCAFDGSGNLWRVTNHLVPANAQLLKIAVPLGTQTLYAMPALPFGDASEIDALTYDPITGHLIVSQSYNAGSVSMDITGTPTIVTSNATKIGYSSMVPGLFGFRVCTPNTSRLNGGATWFEIAGFALLKNDLSTGFSTVLLGPTHTDPSVGRFHNLDDTNSNPHKTSIIDMTLWAMTPGGIPTAFEWFDIAIINSAHIPITLSSNVPSPPGGDHYVAPSGLVSGTAQTVPLDNSPNQFWNISVSVDGKSIPLQVALRYNEIAQYWVATIYDQNGNLLLDSVPFVTGVGKSQNLLAQFAYLKIGSATVFNASRVS